MGKVLPILGIVGAVFAALVVAVLANAALFVVVLVAVAASIVLVAQRTIAGAVAGLVVLALGVLAALGLAGSVTTEKGGETGFGIAEPTGVLLAFAAMIALPVAATVLRWGDLPRWLAIAGLACAAVAFGLAATDPSDLADHGTIRTIVTSVSCLASMAPAIALLRAGDDEGSDEASPRRAPEPPPQPAPLASAEAAVQAHRAPKPSGKPGGRRP